MNDEFKSFLETTYTKYNVDQNIIYSDGNNCYVGDDFDNLNFLPENVIFGIPVHITSKSIKEIPEGIEFYELTIKGTNITKLPNMVVYDLILKSTKINEFPSTFKVKNRFTILNSTDFKFPETLITNVLSITDITITQIPKYAYLKHIFVTDIKYHDLLQSTEFAYIDKIFDESGTYLEIIRVNGFVLKGNILKCYQSISTSNFNEIIQHIRN